MLEQSRVRAVFDDARWHSASKRPRGDLCARSDERLGGDECTRADARAVEDGGT